MTANDIIKQANEDGSIEIIDFIKLAILQEREEHAKISNENAAVIANLKEEINNLCKQNRQLKSIINDIRMRIMGV